MVTINTVATCLLTGGRDRLSTPEIESIAKTLGVTTRSVYRYLEKITKAKFLIRDVDIKTMA